MHKKFSILKRDTLIKDFFHVEKLQLTHEKFDGTESEVLDRFVLYRPDAVAAVVHERDTDRIYFVRQFRVGMIEKEEYPWSLELPAGLVDKGESPEEALIREVMEETGFRLGDIQLIHTFYPSPGILSERIFLFYAPVNSKDRIEKGGGSSNEGEDLQIVHYNRSQIGEHLRNGEITDAKTLLGLYSAGGLYDLEI